MTAEATDSSGMATGIIIGRPDALTATIEFPGGLSTQAFDTLSEALPGRKTWSSEHLADSIARQARANDLEAVTMVVGGIRWSCGLDDLSGTLVSCFPENTRLLDVVRIEPRIMLELILTECHPDDIPELTITLRVFVREYDVSLITQIIAEAGGKLDAAYHRLVPVFERAQGRHQRPGTRLHQIAHSAWSLWVRVNVIEDSQQLAG